MKNSLLNTLPALLPLIYAYAEKHEANILGRGLPLTDAEQVDARRAGVAQPDKIRRLCVFASLPCPSRTMPRCFSRRSAAAFFNSPPPA